ncbi:MAG TPA: PAS domain S-box protein, partial [Candidatus Kapabacteria bacterium]|nr:PAS domain S-box protein [Candidatus Kapabacteria bacterium]
NNSLFLFDKYNKSDKTVMNIPVGKMQLGGFYFVHYKDDSNWMKYAPIFTVDFRKFSDMIVIFGVNFNFIPLEIRVGVFDKFISEQDFEKDSLLAVNYKGMYDELRKLGFEVHSTMLGKEGIEMFKSLNNPLILLDYNLPDMNGFDVIDELRREGYNVEFITMTAFGNEHVAVEMMKRGARDYIVKDMNFLDFLPSVVLNTVNRIQVESKLEESQRALKQAQERYYELFENSLDAIFYTNTDGVIQGCNKSMLKLLGYEKQEIETINIRDLFANYTDRMSFINEIETNGFVDNFEAQLLNKNGEILSCLIVCNLRYNSANKKIGYEGIIHDITARKKAEIKLAESEAKYRSLFERIPLGLYITTPDGKFIDGNQELLKMLGISSKEELNNINGRELYLNPDDRDRWLQSIEKNNVVYSEMQMITPSGKVIWVQDSARAVRDLSGKVLFYEGVLKDITEKKEYEQEREKLIAELKSSKAKIEQLANEIMDLNYELIVSAEQLKNINQSKDKLFSIIAHDLKSPFTGFMGLTELISKDIDDLTKEEIVIMADALNASAKNIYELLINLLEWSRLQGGLSEINIEPLNLKRNVEVNLNLASHQASRKGIKLINEIDEKIYVLADKNMLQTLLRNLISNAIKFTNTDGYVKLYIKEVFSDAVTFCVEDNGIGMDENAIKSLFRIDKHYTTLGTQNEKGTGLGLILCKELLDKSNGRISVESQVGVGTKFFVTLPKFVNE